MNHTPTTVPAASPDATSTAAPAAIDREAQDAMLATHGYAPIPDDHFIDYGLREQGRVRRWFWGEARAESAEALMAAGRTIDPNGVWTREEYAEELGGVWTDDQILASIRGFFDDCESDEAGWAAKQAAG